MGCNPSPPASSKAFTYDNLFFVPEVEGVYTLFDEDHNVLCIRGANNLLNSLMREFDDNDKAARFEYEENKDFSQRTNELVQAYQKEHGEMPGGDDADD